jgi:hypothetical protein
MTERVPFEHNKDYVVYAQREIMSIISEECDARHARVQGLFIHWHLCLYEHGEVSAIWAGNSGCAQNPHYNQ